MLLKSCSRGLYPLAVSVALRSTAFSSMNARVVMTRPRPPSPSPLASASIRANARKSVGKKTSARPGSSRYVSLSTVFPPDA